MSLLSQSLSAAHAPWRVAVVHPNPEPIIEVARELGEFSLRALGDAAASPLDEKPDVWMVRRDHLEKGLHRYRHRAHPPLVIALSPSDGSADEWFARGVFDFLVEPLTAQRLRAALERARQYLERAHIVDALRTLARPASLIALLTPRRVLFVAAAEIDWAQAAANGITVCARSRQYPVRESLADFAARLPPDDFIQLRRSLVVSLRCLKAVESRGHGELAVTLKGGRRIPVGPTYRRALEQLIESASAALRAE